jgi:hypothetical protein
MVRGSIPITRSHMFVQVGGLAPPLSMTLEIFVGPSCAMLASLRLELCHEDEPAPGALPEPIVAPIEVRLAA